MQMVYMTKINFYDRYMFLIAVIAGKVEDFDSYFLTFVYEVRSLGEYGLIVKKHNGEIIKLIMASGDIPQVINKKKKKSSKF